MPIEVNITLNCLFSLEQGLPSKKYGLEQQFWCLSCWTKLIASMLIEPKHAWDLTSIVLPPGLLWNCALLNTATGTKEDASEFRIQILRQKKWHNQPKALSHYYNYGLSPWNIQIIPFPLFRPTHLFLR